MSIPIVRNLQSIEADAADFLKVTVSTILYWYMIEAGLAIIAACLPSLQFLIRKVSLDRMIRSVRSALSLQSTRSQNSQSKFMGPYIDMKADGDVPSVTTMVGKGGTSEDLVMGSITRPSENGDGIYLTSEISQRDDMV